MTTHLEHAEGWVIAAFRGNNDCSDDKAIHHALNCLSDYYFWPRDKGSARKRLDAMTRYADKMTPRGRGVLVGCWALRDKDNGDRLWGVGRSSCIWGLLSEAEKQGDL